MIVNARVLSSLAMAMIFGAASLYAAFALGPQARTMPLLVALPGFGLSAMQLVSDLRCKTSKVEEGPLLEGHQWRILFWIAGCIPMIIAFGFNVSTPVLVATYHRFIHRESYTISLLSSSIAFFVVTIILDIFFGAQLFSGLLTPMIVAWFR
jgi:hypothetical protein